MTAGSLDLAFAVRPSVHLSDEQSIARRIVEVLPEVPTLVWGRDEMRAGEMWSCNSIISRALTRAGVNTAFVGLPPGGRAPGWDAGVAVAHNHAPALGAPIAR